MQEVIRYITDDGAEHLTKEKAIEHEYINAMFELGFRIETARKIYDSIDEIKQIMNERSNKLEKIRLVSAA